MRSTEIYISYAKSDETESGLKRQAVFEFVFRILKKKGYSVLTENNLPYKGSISEYTAKLGKGKYIILIISDAYLKSKECMAEIIEIQKHSEFKDRVFPVVLDDAKIHDAVNIIDYLVYWENQINELNEKIKSLNNPAYILPIQKEIDLLNTIRSTIANFSAFIGDMKTVILKGNKITHFKELLESIEIQRKKEKKFKSSKFTKYILSFFLFDFIVGAFMFFFIPSKVIFNSDVNCEIQINGEEIYMLQATSAKTVKLSRGNYRIVAFLDDSEVRDTEIIDINHFWQNKVVVFDLAEKIDESDFMLAMKTNKIEKYEEYLIKHPTGKYAEIVKQQLENFKNIPVTSNSEEEKVFKIAQNTNKASDYTEYLSKYPQGKYAEVVKKYMQIVESRKYSNDIDKDLKAFLIAKKSNTIEAYTDYLNKFPNGKHVEEIKNIISERQNNVKKDEESDFYYSQVKKKNNIESYQEYLQKYPEGKYKTNANLAIDSIKDYKAYENALNINNIRAFEAYIDQYPNGQWVSGARNMIQGRSEIHRQGMILIKSGVFKMWKDKHQVKVYSFYIDRYEVTVSQYRAFCKAKGKNMPRPPKWGWIDDHPIVNVSWNDAYEYAEWAGKRLPTEAEWEYACQHENQNLLSISWFQNNSGNQTRPVGLKEPNANGLWDTRGNVWEWCFDWYQPGSYFANSPFINPQGPASGTTKVLRGGSWFNDTRSMDFYNRIFAYPNQTSNYYGFRCVAD